MYISNHYFGGILLQPINRQHGKRQLIGMLIIALVAVLEITLYYYFEIYLDKIISIDSISIEVKQHSDFQLPKTVEAKLKSNKYKKVAVRWDKDYINTDKIETCNFEGRVEGFNDIVKLKVDISKYIKSIERPNIVILLTDNSNLQQRDLNLPDTLSVVYSDDKKGKEKVQWQKDSLVINNTGDYEITGSFLKDMLCEPRIVCKLEVIDRGELIKRIVVQTSLIQEEEVSESIDKIKALPNSVLEVLLKDRVTIRYVERNITDMPEFESLRKHEADNLKVFGVFKYPQIVVDYQAKKYIKFTDLDSFYTITLHEVGHAYDYLVGGRNNFELSSSDEFLSIWQREARNLFKSEITNMTEDLNKYYIDYNYEFFAECFAFYYQNEESKSLLKKNAPETYEYITKVMDKY